MTSGSSLTGLSHIDLSVSDRLVSADWYARTLGFENHGDEFNDAAGLQWVHLVHPCGLQMGLVEHPDNPGEPFDERRTGLDHVSFAVASREAIDELARRAIANGCAALVNETSAAVLLVLRDPDDIQVEVCYWKAPDHGVGVVASLRPDHTNDPQ